MVRFTKDIASYCKDKLREILASHSSWRSSWHPIDIPTWSLIAARQGTAEPDQLQHGDIHMCISGGKDRKRVWLKPIKNPNMKKAGKDSKRTIVRSIMLHVTESSWRSRRKTKRGQARLTQMIHMAGSASTFSAIKHKTFEGITGSTLSDVMGPVTQESIDDLPAVPASEKRVFYGKRFKLAGGPVDGADDDDPDDNEDLVVSDDEEVTDDVDKDPPVAWHCLPTCVVLALMKAFNIKHVIDLCPTPLNLAYRVLASGGTYVALCASVEMKTYLSRRLHSDLMQGIVDENEPLLYDPRFKLQASGALSIYICIYMHIERSRYDSEDPVDLVQSLIAVNRKT